MDKSARFIKRGNELIVTNTGLAFSPGGLESITTAYRSPKSGKGQTSSNNAPYKNRGDAGNHIARITERHIQTYHSDFSRLEEDAGNESETRQDYSSRVLLELLQNTDDANSKKPIGHKGLGFKSILDITENPRIYSGHLSVCFDRERADGLLSAEGLELDSALSAPILRLPFISELLHEDPLVQQLAKEYTTVIILPFRDAQEANEFVEREWSDTADDETLFLFMHSLDRVIWDLDGQEQEWSCERKRTAVTISNVKPNEALIKKWRIFRAGDASIAVAMDRGRPLLDDQHDFLRSYFRTKESNPFPKLLIHLGLDLKQNRDYFRWAEAPEQLFVSFGEVIAKVAKSMSYPEDVLSILEIGHIAKDAPPLYEAAIQAIREIPVKNTNIKRWGDVRLLPEVTNYQYAAHKDEIWLAFKRLLQNNNSEILNELSLLPPGTETAENIEVVKGISEQQHWSHDDLFHHAKILSTEPTGKDFRYQTLYEMGDKFPDLPACHGIDMALVQFDYEFLEDFDSVDIIEAAISEELRSIGLPEFSSEDIIEDLIIPLLENESALDSKNLINFIFALKKDELDADGFVFHDWRDANLALLAESITVETSDGSRKTAKDVYMGKAWGNSAFIDDVYKNRKNRYLLHSPKKKWSKEISSLWRSFYQWLGVGWYPQILPLVNYETNPASREGPIWNVGGFSIANSPKNWTDYCSAIEDQLEEPYLFTTRLRTNSTIDLTLKELRITGALESISAGWDEYYQEHLRARVVYSSAKSRDNDNRVKDIEPFWMWSLRNNPWISGNDSDRFWTVRDTFLVGEVADALGAWINVLETYDQISALQSLGVRKHWEDLSQSDWRRWLSEALNIKANGRAAKNREAIEALYRHFLRRSDDADWYEGLWAVSRTDSKNKQWIIEEDHNAIFYVDEPFLRDICVPGLQTFPVILGGRKKKAGEKLGLPALSENLTGRVIRRDEREANALISQLARRKSVILAYIGLNYSDERIANCAELFDQLRCLAFDPLEVAFVVCDSEESDPTRQKMFFNKEEATLYVDYKSGFDKDCNVRPLGWDCMAAGIVYMLGAATDKRANVKDLLSYSDADLPDKLYDLELPPEEVEELIKFSIERNDNFETESSQGAEAKDNSDSVRAEDFAADATAQENDTVESSTQRPGKERGSAPISKGNSSDNKSLPFNGLESDLETGNLPNPDNSEDATWAQAETYVREQLKQKLEPYGWRVSEAPVRDEHNAETDILLSAENRPEYHIEVKNMEGNRIIWTEKEIGKAQRNEERYVMVIARTSSSESEVFDIHWIEKPLKTLENCEINGVWRWSANQELIREEVQAWDVPNSKPARQANGFSFQVILPDEDLKSTPFGINYIFDILGLDSMEDVDSHES